MVVDLGYLHAIVVYVMCRDLKSLEMKLTYSTPVKSIVCRCQYKSLLSKVLIVTWLYCKDT